MEISTGKCFLLAPKVWKHQILGASSAWGLMFVEMIFEKKGKTGSLSPKKIDLGTNTLGSLEV